MLCDFLTITSNRSCLRYKKSFFSKMDLKKTCQDFSKLTQVNLGKTMENNTKTMENIHVRLEELETMINFEKQDFEGCSQVLYSVLNSAKDLDDITKRIDRLEELVQHVKGTLNETEEKIAKQEEAMGCSEASFSMASLLSPLFKKSPEVSPSSTPLEPLNTDDYFEKP